MFPRSVFYVSWPLGDLEVQLISDVRAVFTGCPRDPYRYRALVKYQNIVKNDVSFGPTAPNVEDVGSFKPEGEGRLRQY